MYSKSQLAGVHTESPDLGKAAAWYIKNLKLNVIATNEVKQSLFDWKRYSTEMIDLNDLLTQLRHPKAAGIAVICGAVSGGLEVIDIDLKYALDPQYYDRLSAAIDPEIMGKLYVVKTRSGGYHWYYRCEEITGNKKLAMRPKTEQELKENPNGKKICLIETRGEGGYVIAPPTEGYSRIGKGNIPLLTIDEREALWSACRSFNEVYEDKAVDVRARPANKEFGLSPFDDYNRRGDVVELLVKHGWTVVADTPKKVLFKRPGKTDSKTSGNYNKDLGWFSVFTTNSCFEPETAYRPYAVFTMLEADGDFKKAARMLADQGFGEKRVSYGSKIEHEVFKRKADGMDREGLVTFLVQKKEKTMQEAEEIIDTLEKQWGDKVCTFWDINKNGRPEINRTRLETFLYETGGFCLYFHGQSKIYRLVRIQDGRVEEANTEQIKKFIKQYILSLPDSFDGGVSPMELLEVIYKGSNVFFSDAFLEFIDRRHIDFLKDEPTKAFFPFNNGVVVIEKGKDPVMKTYGEVGRYVWAGQVIDFDIAVDQSFDASLCEYYRFLDNISGKEQERLEYAISLIGYMLHGWKNPSRPYAPILAEETDDERKGGGTGKGLFIKAVSKLIPVVTIDGKNFKVDKNFAFQRVSFDTKLIVIEDCPKNVDFEKFYPTITEGVTIEKKNKDEIFLPYAESPKIAFTTNYSISQDAEHSKRRQRVFEFAPHYSSKYTPEDEFGHKFFDDWDRDEWNRFYNMLFFCVGVYLDRGILMVQNSDKMKRKHIKLKYGEEFLDWWDDFAANGRANWHSVTGEYKSFLISNEFDKKDYSPRRFRYAVQEAAGSMGLAFETRRNRQNSNVTEFRVQDKE
jgi:hypothetical protein